MSEEKQFGLKVGDKYLTIELNLGVLGTQKVSAFKQEETTKGYPNFKGKGVAVWINTKTEAKKELL